MSKPSLSERLRSLAGCMALRALPVYRRAFLGAACEIERLQRELDAKVEYHDWCGMEIENALGSDLGDHGLDRYGDFAESIRRLRARAASPEPHS